MNVTAKRSRITYKLTQREAELLRQSAAFCLTLEQCGLAGGRVASDAICAVLEAVAASQADLEELL